MAGVIGAAIGAVGLGSVRFQFRCGSGSNQAIQRYVCADGRDPLIDGFMNGESHTRKPGYVQYTENNLVRSAVTSMADHFLDDCEKRLNMIWQSYEAYLSNQAKMTSFSLVMTTIRNGHQFQMFETCHVLLLSIVYLDAEGDGVVTTKERSKASEEIGQAVSKHLPSYYTMETSYGKTTNLRVGERALQFRKLSSLPLCGGRMLIQPE
ncbi:hypothetical protein KCU87_g494, partial [Aureobasidium melanogenum]